jgi:hypothetical protein
MDKKVISGRAALCMVKPLPWFLYGRGSFPVFNLAAADCFLPQQFPLNRLIQNFVARIPVKDGKRDEIKDFYASPGYGRSAEQQIAGFYRLEMSS